MKNWDVYIWKNGSGIADDSRNVEAEDEEGALNATMDQLGLENAYSAQIFADGEGNATYFDKVSSDGTGAYSAEKKWRW